MQKWKETTRDASTRARCGVIDVSIDEGTRTARTRTPCALVPTSRGEHATLTRDVLDDVERRLTRAFSRRDEDKADDPTTTTSERMFGCVLVGSHFVRKSERGYKRKRKNNGDEDDNDDSARRSDALERCPPKRRLAIGHYRDATYFGLNTQTRTSKSSNALMCETPYGQKTLGPEAYMRGWRGDAHAACALADEHAGWESEKKSKSSAIVTVGWLDACVEEIRKMESGGGDAKTTSLWGVVLGGGYERVREECALKVAERDASLDGYVLGGFYAGEDETTREACVETVLRHVPEGKPRYFPGVMTIEDVVGHIERGVDVFDAAWASETAARGRAFCFPISPDADVDTDAIDSTPCAFSGRDAYSINVWSTAYKTDFVPFLGAKDRCACPACADHTRAYVHHLLQAHEMTADVLLEAHNLYHLASFFAAARAAIENGSWVDFAEFHRAYARKARGVK